MLTLAEADTELQRLNLLKKNHLDEQYVARRRVRDLPAAITSLSERLSKLTADEAATMENADKPITIGKRIWSRGDALAALAGQLDAMPKFVNATTRVPIGVYQGLRFGLVLHPQFPPDVYLEGEITRQTMLSREHQGPRAVLNALERLANGFDSEITRVRQDLAIAKSQIHDYQESLGRPFPHDSYLTELTNVRDQLKAGLSAAAQMQGDDARPSVFDLAEKIKTLKAANTIEAAPQRDRQEQSTAEEPVTTRIRRRAEAYPNSDQAMKSDAPSEGKGTPTTESELNSPAKPLMTFPEKIATERQRKDQEPSLS